MIKTDLKTACLALVLLTLLPPAWALEPVGPVSEAALQLLREQTGQEPTAEELVDALNQAVAGYYRDGKYAQAETSAREALALAERDLGKEHPKTPISLNNLAELYRAQGRYDEAEPLYLRALKAQKRILGQDHPHPLTSLNNLAVLYRDQGRYGEAEPLYLRALKASERVLGQDHPNTLGSLNNLAELYRAQGRYGEAEPLYVRALEAYERTFSQEHPDTLGSLNGLAVLYHEQGRYGEAEPLYLRALKASERVLGQDHPQTLTSLNNLAMLYRDQGRYGEAEPLHLRALKASERVLGQDHPRTLGSLNNLAMLYQDQGRYGEAEPLYQRVLKASERVLGQDHPQTLSSLNNLAVLYRDQGRYDKAEQLYLRALESRERILGWDHPDTLIIISNLAELYQAQGRYGESESLYQRTLKARERILGKDHPATLISLNGLAMLYQDQGRYSESEPLYQRALKSSEQTLGQDHPHTLVSVNNLAELYQDQGRYDKAEPLYQRALKAHERILGKDHPQTLISINNLALLYQIQGRYDEAEPLLVQALKARERVLGQDHPDTLVSLNNLAKLYQAQGSYDESESLYVRALEVSERILGQGHPNTLTIQLNLAVALVNKGQPERALGELHRMDERRRGFVGNQLDTTLKERVRRHWLWSESNFQDIVFSLALQQSGSDGWRLAADVLLRWKRLAGEAEALIARFVRAADDPQVKETAERLARRRADLSRLVNLQEPDDEDKSAAHANAIALALKDVERLEVGLAALSREFRDQRANLEVGWEQARSGLPKSSALLSLRAFRPVDFATGDSGEPRWLGLVIPVDPGDGSEILLKDLGPIAPTTWIRRALRETTSLCPPAAADNSPRETGDELARNLYWMLFGELDAELAQYGRLYIAPDGELDLVPFARLVLPDGRYWIQRQTLHQLQTGRDLIKSDSDPTTAAGMIVYGGVNYGERKCTRRACVSRDEGAGDPSVANGGVDGDRMLAMNRRLRGEGRCFTPLPSSGEEAKAVGRLYWDSDDHKAEIWRGRDASESRLRSLASPPRILHLATHGFFLDRKSGSSERPLTLAGLALAGANDTLKDKSSLPAAEEDGILYALEVLDLNLAGTELVTLSACDTGRGEVDYSEGVYGLVRGFRIAGARHVLMSLWKLDDSLAKGFMRDFYATWIQYPAPHPREALRKTQLKWIHSKDPEDPKAPKRRDPKYWAPYVLIEGR